MKRKKILAFTILTLVITLISATGVSAAEHYGYAQVTLPARQDIQLNQNVAPSQNYKYVMHYVANFQREGNAVLHNQYKAHYGGNNYTVVGKELDIQSKGSAVWYPSNVGGRPAGWTVVDERACNNNSNGTDSNGNYCALQGRSYNLYMYSNNYLYSMTYNGQFSFTN